MNVEPRNILSYQIETGLCLNSVTLESLYESDPKILFSDPIHRETRSVTELYELSGRMSEDAREVSFSSPTRFSFGR